MRLINNNISVDFETLFFYIIQLYITRKGFEPWRKPINTITPRYKTIGCFETSCWLELGTLHKYQVLGQIFFHTVGIINCNQQLVYCKISQMRSPANSSNLFYSLQPYKWVPALLFHLHGSQSCLIFNNST